MLYILMEFRHHRNLEGGYNGAHFTDEETEVLRGAMTCPSPSARQRYRTTLQTQIRHSQTSFPCALLPPSSLALEAEGAAIHRGSCQMSGLGF